MPRYREEEIIELLREVEHRSAQGEQLSSVCKSLGISQSSYRRWQKKYGKGTQHGLSAAASLGVGATTAAAEGPKLSEQARELLDAANAASGPARTAWLAFLALLAYFLVTLGGVSHSDLLLNSPVKLPIINVDIPLFSFFQYAPALVLLVYLSLLVQHVILAQKYRRFSAAIAPYEHEAKKEHSARQLVHSYVVSQLLAGPKTNSVVRWFMRLMVFVTITLLPVATLLYFQIKFLPYHDVGTTYWHRIAVVLAFAMLFVFLPIINFSPRERQVKIGAAESAWQKSPIRILMGLAFAVVVIGFSWLIATVPNEPVERLMGFVEPTGPREGSLLNPVVRAGFNQTSNLLNFEFEDEVHLLNWLLPFRVLVVEDTDLVPDEDDPHGEVSLVLRDRDLWFAQLSRSDLHRADLTNADLRGADLTFTRLEDAQLEGAQLQGATLREADLQGADLQSAKLQGAFLRDAYLQNANFLGARLHGAALFGSNLQDAGLTDAELQGATLDGADLRGAFLQGADLRGATLWSADLRGANLDFADLQGASLEEAVLQGASLKSADLRGANLRGAKLQGANLSGAQLQGSDLENAEIWLASFPADSLIKSPAPLGLTGLTLQPLTVEARKLLEESLKEIEDERLLADLRDRLDTLLRDEPPEWEGEDEWRQSVSQATEVRPDELIPFLAEIACEDHEGYIAGAFAYRIMVFENKANRRLYAKSLARALLDENCQGAQTLGDDRRERLRELASSAD